MRNTPMLLFLGLLGAAPAGVQAFAQAPDTGVAVLQERGRAAMGSDEYSSMRGMMGSGMMMGRGPMMGGDSAFAADMSLVHALLRDYRSIRRTVVPLPNGIRTVTESDNPRVADFIISHVVSMEQRLKDGNIFNVASKTLPTIFQNREKIRTEVLATPKGATLTQTSDDSVTVAALKAHAGEVSELVREGMVAMMRSVMAGAGPMGGGMGMMGEMGMMGGMGGGTQGTMTGGCPMMGQPMQHGDSTGSGPPAPPRH